MTECFESVINFIKNCNYLIKKFVQVVFIIVLKSSMTETMEGSVGVTNDSPIARNDVIFTFSNGDKYEGGYRINGDKGYLVRQGQGIYRTDDFDSYEATWENDKIAGDVSHVHHVRFNNGTVYKGHLHETNGSTSGTGVYHLPDGSSFEAIWSDNLPVSDIRYKEPLGYSWKEIRLSDDGHSVRLMAGNHFWEDSKRKPATEPIEN